MERTSNGVIHVVAQKENLQVIKQEKSRNYK